jgi:hypothetical protein
VERAERGERGERVREIRSRYLYFNVILRPDFSDSLPSLPSLHSLHSFLTNLRTDQLGKLFCLSADGQFILSFNHDPGEVFRAGVADY